MGPIDLFGIRFRPGGLGSFFTLDAAELADERADLSCFAEGLAAELWERLAGAAPAMRPAIVDEALRAGFARIPIPASAIASPGSKLRAALCRSRGSKPRTGLSGRQIERRFARHIGLAPKTFARIVRFRSLLLAAAAPAARDWAGLAAEHGYADQPHMVREFRSLHRAFPLLLFRAGPPRMSDSFKTVAVDRS